MLVVMRCTALPTIQTCTVHVMPSFLYGLFTGDDCSRLLWLPRLPRLPSGYLLAANWDENHDAHGVVSWEVKGSSDESFESTHRIGDVLDNSLGVDINCWCALPPAQSSAPSPALSPAAGRGDAANHVVLYDANTEKLVLYHMRNA